MHIVIICIRVSRESFGCMWENNIDPLWSCISSSSQPKERMVVYHIALKPPHPLLLNPWLWFRVPSRGNLANMLHRTLWSVLPIWQQWVGWRWLNKPFVIRSMIQLKNTKITLKTFVKSWWDCIYSSLGLSLYQYFILFSLRCVGQERTSLQDTLPPILMKLP